MGDLTWPEGLLTKVIALDFDKTITVKHTRGAVYQTAGLEKEELEKNIADLEFMRKFIPWASKHAKVAIATFADTDEEALISGKDLVRKYLDVICEGDSTKYIPDSHIEAWNPENQDKDMKVVGKNEHLGNLKKRLGKLKKYEIALFDDSDRNIMLATKSGYAAQFCKPCEPGADGGPHSPGGFNGAIWKEFVEKEKDRSPGGCIIS